MKNSIDIRISAMSLSKLMIKEYKEPGILDYIYVSVVSLIVSVLFHITVEYIFSNIQFFLNKIIMFIVNTITTI
jgi:hypothetical protein